MFDILQQSAIAGGKVLLKYFRKNIQIAQKTSHHDIVTQADLEAQQTIVDIIIREAEKHDISKDEIGVIGEEGGNEIKKYTFVIDPLDGTSNFTHNIEYFVVSIGCFKNGKPHAGLIYNPITEITYYAKVDKGAFKIQKGGKTKLHLIPLDLKDAILTTNISENETARKAVLNICDIAMKHIHKIRIYGATALDLCIMSDNQCSIVIYGRTSLWDIAAGIIIAREAGAEVYDFEGKPIEMNLLEKHKKYQILAVHPQLFLKYFPIFQNSIKQT